MQMATFLGPDEHFLETWELPIDQQKPEWSKLPFSNDELWPFAKRHGFSDPGASDYRQYRQKLQREIDVRLQQGATYATNK